MSIRSRAGAACIAALLLLSACDSSSADEDEPVCDPADKAVVAEIMSKARTGFKDGDTIHDHFDFVKGATAPIPEAKRQFGAERVMVLLIKLFIRDDDVTDGFQGALGPVWVVLDGDGKPLAPLGANAQPFFDIQPPADPGWTAWADGLADSDFAYDLFGCVNPN
ncbi:hypothetical protein [Aeromicrobium wangtongii]|uniref:Uncharacterized protein n=1 Tax=Aeromicrobium wangtongii TaxID=2969247 RepID=A0ABY5M903_9ACTN|nr:hypothetical protein [Aeromicrobium wangtongii]MCD9200169.1 hypothetical protein [Aeromicrobium wangtongii]UUP13424.1 hypothetical protein NQV15_16475 [Aeromicrobium wangtongii]